MAESVARDADTNNVSVFNILENIRAEGFPVFIQRLASVVLWERDEQDNEKHSGSFQVRIGHEVLMSELMELDFQGHPRTRNFVRLNGLVIPQPGELEFKFELDSGEKATYKIAIDYTGEANSA